MGKLTEKLSEYQCIVRAEVEMHSVGLLCQYPAIGVRESNFILFLGRLLRVDLIKWFSNVRPYVRLSVRLSTKSVFDFSEIRYVGRGRRLMHNGMQYDPIQGQGQEQSKVGNSATFKGYLLPHL